MGSSSRRGMRSYGLGAATRFRGLGAALLAVVWGCGHSSATPPTPPAPAPVARSAPAPREAYAGAAPGSTTTVPAQPDPSEAITPRELASIPDPVPENPARGSAPARTASPPKDVMEAPGAPPAAESPAPAPLRADPGDGRPWVWRVQLIASPDLAQADRIAKEASTRFGEPYVIEFEGALYKVRLGSFGSEAQAQALRERAVREGFPGAFRMRSEAPVTSSAK